MEEVTFYFFLSHTKAYLKQLLTEPSSAKVDDELLACLKSIGLSQEDFLKCLLDKDIIERKESVDDDIYNGHEKATFSIKYQVPRKNFERKLQKLHIELFSEDSDKPIIDEKTKKVIGFPSDLIHGGKLRMSPWDTGLDMENWPLYHENLDEAIIRSYPAKNIIANLMNTFAIGAPDWYSEKVHTGIIWETNAKIFILLKPSEKLSTAIKDRMFDFGWNCYHDGDEKTFKPEESKIIGDKYIALIFDKKFNEDMTDNVKRAGKLYHFANVDVIKKIKENGLCPKLSSWSLFNGGDKNDETWLPENDKKNYARIYLFTKENAVNPISYFASKPHRENTYYELEIDVAKCPNAKFYYDPRMRYAVYTFDNIPPEAIKVIKEYGEKEKPINEDGEGGGATAADASGQFSQPLFGEPIKRKIYVTREQFERLKEAVEVDNRFGEFGYDAPGLAINKDDPTMKHRKKNGGISWEHAEEEKK